jgi:hypothetical protein
MRWWMAGLGWVVILVVTVIVAQYDFAPWRDILIVLIGLAILTIGAFIVRRGFWIFSLAWIRILGPAWIAILVVAAIVAQEGFVSYRAIFTTLVGIVILNIAIVAVAVGLRNSAQLPNDAQLTEFIRNLWKRYTSGEFPEPQSPTVQDADRLVGYAERVVDRQINKARGILPFNSIIIAVLSIEKSRILSELWDIQTVITLLAFFVVLAGLIISSFLCLELFLFRWGESGRYLKFSDEFGDTIKLVRKRSATIEWATVLSTACLFGALLFVAMAELNVRPSNAQMPTIAAPPPPVAPSAQGLGSPAGQARQCVTQRGWCWVPPVTQPGGTCVCQAGTVRDLGRVNP